MEPRRVKLFRALGSSRSQMSSPYSSPQPQHLYSDALPVSRPIAPPLLLLLFLLLTTTISPGLRVSCPSSGFCLLVTSTHIRPIRAPPAVNRYTLCALASDREKQRMLIESRIKLYTREQQTAAHGQIWPAMCFCK